MKYILPLLLAVSVRADTIPGHTFLDFEASTDGTVVTSAIASNCVRAGRVFEMYMSSDPESYSAGSPSNIRIETDAQRNLFTPVQVGSSTYDGTGSRGLRVTHGANGFIHFNLGSTAIPEMSLGFYLRWSGPAVNWAPRDTAAMTDFGGRYQFLQIYDNASGSLIPYFHTHWAFSGIGNNINFTRGQWYWVTMSYAQVGETFRIRYYNADTQALLGESTGTGIASGSVGPRRIVFGLVRYGDTGTSAQYFDFDNFIINTNGTFPLGPGTGPDAGVDMSMRLTGWNADTTGIAGGIPHRTTISATLNPGDNIQTAINNCPVGQVVKLNAGTYDISGITINKSITLRGSGQTTQLRHNGDTGITIESSQLTGAEASANLVSGYTKDSSNVVISASIASLRTNYIVLLDQLNSDFFVFPDGNNGSRTDTSRQSGARLRAQAVKVTSIHNGTNIGFWPPLTFYLTNSLDPELYFRVGGTTNNYVSMAGVEDLTVTNRSSGAGINFLINRAESCWLSNVWSRNSYDWHVSLRNCYRTEIRHSLFRGVRTTANGTGYCISYDYQPCFNRFEDNIIADNRQFVQVNGGGTGNAVLYNYMTNATQGAAPSFTVKSGGHHNAHPMMNLWEGNIGYKMTGDFTWGSSSHNTWLRNWLRALMPYSSQSGCALELEEGSTYCNVLGNILGYPNISSQGGFTTWSTLRVSPANMDYDSVYASLRIGYYNSSDSGGGFNATNRWLTHVVWKNYDYVSGSQLYMIPSGSGAMNLTNSYFYTSKPAYFGTLPWPPIDPASPATSIVETNIPAGYRWRYGVDPGSSADVTPPTVTAATINAAGTTLTVNFDEATIGTAGFTLTPSGGAATVSNPAGSGTAVRTYTISRAIASPETVELDYTPGGFEDSSGNLLAPFADFAVVNNSTYETTPPAGVSITNCVALSGKFVLVEGTATDASALTFVVHINGSSNTVSQSSPSFTITNLPVYSTNYFRLVATDLHGNSATSAFSGTVTFTQAVYNASGTFSTPAGVTNILVEAWGGGAGGGGSSSTSRQPGGPSGAYARGNLTVIPTTIYTVTVGGGGAVSAASAAGGISWFNNSATLLAVGGTNEIIGTDGTPGLATSCIGAVRFSGSGYGVRAPEGNPSAGGGGGGSPTWFGVGTAGTGGSGSTAGTGGAGEGAGGNGGGVDAAGSAGAQPGGGGGGHGSTVSNPTLSSGVGGAGRVIVAWGVPDSSDPEEDVTDPVVAIWNPGTNFVATSTTPLGISANVSDDVGLVSARVFNLTSGANVDATVNGTNALASIAVQPGLNTIRFSAFDAAGNVGHDYLTNLYTPPPIPDIFVTNATTILLQQQ